MERNDNEEITPEEIEADLIYRTLSDEIEHLQNQIDNPLPDVPGPRYEFGKPFPIRPEGTKAKRVEEQKKQRDELILLRAEKVDKSLVNCPDYIKARAHARIEDIEHSKKDPAVRKAQQKEISDSQQYLFKRKNEYRLDEPIKVQGTQEKKTDNEKEQERVTEDFLSSFSYSATPYHDKITTEYRENSRDIVVEPDRD